MSPKPREQPEWSPCNFAWFQPPSGNPWTDGGEGGPAAAGGERGQVVGGGCGGGTAEEGNGEQCCQIMAKFDPFLSKERKGSNFAASQNPIIHRIP